MIYFFDPQFAATFFLFLILAIFGTLQLVAGYHRLAGLSIFGETDPLYGNYVVGGALVVGDFVWFFATQWSEVYRPGPAGAELTLLFGVAGLLALGLTLLTNSLIRELRSESSPPTASHSARVQEVELRDNVGRLLLPLEEGCCPGIAAISDPTISTPLLEPIAFHLVERGFAVLMLQSADGVPDHPEAVAVLPTACNYLVNHPDVEGDNIAILGFGLGADLALAAAGSDEQIVTAVGLAPLLEPANARPGLGLLREMSYYEAMRWSRFRDRSALLQTIQPLEQVSSSDHCPILLIYGENDGVVPQPEILDRLNDDAQLKLLTVPNVGHLSLSRSLEARQTSAAWFKEHLS